jgi:hypothetical protein
MFYTHDVRPKPSPYGCTPALFEFAVSAALESGSRVLTVAQALNESRSALAAEVVQSVRPAEVSY